DYLGQAQAQDGAYLWWRAVLPAAESAVLLFCPLPAREARTEAAWRVLAQLYEGPFYRRLRTELQLGYAVFSGFRQLGEQAGLLFAVQSPKASAAEILGHIEGFLAERTGELAALSECRLAQECASLGTRLGDPAAGLRSLAEQAWQAQLAGCGADYPRRVRAALQTLPLHELRRQQQALLEARGGWRVLANAAPPDPRWQAL
ncbi:MAG: insulinase family protein, partial [Pseudomonas sp.]